MPIKTVPIKSISTKTIQFCCIACQQDFITINSIITCYCPIVTIQLNVRKYINLLHSLNSITYNSQILNYRTINSFVPSTKKYNDLNNKLRESIIGAIINDKIPNTYYTHSKKWNQMKNNIWDFIYKLTNTDIHNVSCIHKGGRKFNYDFEIQINDNLNFNIELKFNAEYVSDAPQFVSPMKPSQYLSNSFEDYYYDNYLPLLADFKNLSIPNRESYLKEIHSTNPKCLIEFQNKYYKGCKQSSQFTNNPDDIQFYIEANRLSKLSISTFIEQNCLNIELLSNYLTKTQNLKHYMLYINNIFHHQTIDINEHELVSYEKQPKKYKFIAKTKSGHSISILLRWKNGNGIAFPAFQIS
jgi:hypothetical protein